MLRAVPREPLRRTVSELVQRLCDEGHDVTTRTVQRDMNELSRIFSLTCDIEGRTQYWYYPKAHKGLDIPGMGAPEALVRSEEHTSELQSLMRISYAVFCLKTQKTNQ